MNPPSPAPKTILFSGHDFRFLRPFMAYCENNSRYQVLVEQHRGHEISDLARCRELLPRAAVIFCEWCLGNAVWYSHNKSSRQTLLVRLHLQELGLPYLDRVQWENVDALILICPRNRELVCQRYPFLQGKTHLIYNPIDCDAFGQPKLPGAAFNLGILGICPKRKEPHLAVEILARLKNWDTRYTLFVKGRHPRDYDWLWQRPEERAYYEQFYDNLERSGCANSVVFETYSDDVPLWLSKIGCILSTSEFEGSHQSVAEGMASGAIPVIRNWAGADCLYPQRFIFSTVDDAVDLLKNVRRLENYDREVAAVRAYAKAMFHQETIIQQLERLISAGENGPGFVPAAAGSRLRSENKWD